MFSVRQKREISDKIQKILRETNHPELPKGEIQFMIHVNGADSWSWAQIRNNGAVTEPEINPHNEAQDLDRLNSNLEMGDWRMRRPKEVEEAMRYKPRTYPETLEHNKHLNVLQKHIERLESKLPREPEEVWEKCRRENGYAALHVKTPFGDYSTTLLPEEIVDEILRNRELVLRGIDWESVKKDLYIGGYPSNAVNIVNIINRNIEAQMKGDK